MTGLEVTSLIALFAAIILGFIRKANVGIIAIGFAVVIGMIYDVSAKTIIEGFSSSLAVMMIGVTYLFGIVSNNGSLDVMAKKLVSLAGKRTYLIPIAIFLLGMLLCGIGPGAIPALAIIPLLAVPIAHKSGYNPLLLAVIGQMGVQGARMSKFTPDAIVVQELMNKQNITGSLLSITSMLLLTEIILAIIIFIAFKGWRLNSVQHVITQEVSIERFNRNQIISLVAIVIMILLVLICNANVGLASFLVGTILILLGIGEEGKAIKSIPWNVLLLIIGVGILMHIVVFSGGMDVLTNAILTIMTPKIASAVMVTLSGILSLFSSGIGVTFPTLIPTCGHISSTLGSVSSVELVAMVVIGGTITGFSPIATTGALAMAAVSSETKGLYPQGKMFMELLGIALVAMFLVIVMALTGTYNLISILIT